MSPAPPAKFTPSRAPWADSVDEKPAPPAAAAPPTGALKARPWDWPTAAAKENAAQPWAPSPSTLKSRPWDWCVALTLNP